MKSLSRPVIYLSVGNMYVSKIQEAITTIGIELTKKFQLSMHDGSNDYDPSKVQNCDILVAYIPKNNIIGKGVWGEIQAAMDSNKKVYLHKDNKLFEHFAIKKLKAVTNWNYWAEVKIKKVKQLINNNSLLLIYGKSY